jgi:glycerol kinase
MAGATVQWLRDNLGLMASAAESEVLAREADRQARIYLVPAFQGLGAPFWDADARGAILGLSRAASKADLVAAGLEAVAFQTRDLLSAMRRDIEESGIAAPSVLRVDGGMTANSWFLQRLADILGESVELAANPETTALGAAYHAGQAAGFFGDAATLAKAWCRRARTNRSWPRPNGRRGIAAGSMLSRASDRRVLHEPPVAELCR